jgi:hypothetical protein
MSETETIGKLAKIGSTSSAMAARRKRSAVTNNTRAYVIGDGNSPWARRQRDLVAIHAEDAGGIENISASRFSLCHRAACLSVELEMMEGRLSLGQEVDLGLQEVDLGLYGILCGHLRRVLETIGVDRVEKPVEHGPLHDHFAKIRRKAASL